MLNICIRTSYRPEQFDKCLYSIYQNTCHIPIKIFVTFDDLRALKYIPKNLITAISCIDGYDKTKPFFYNQYLNAFFPYINDGHILFLDDDDVLLPDSVYKLNLPHAKSCIVPFLRGEHNYKPNRAMMQAHTIHQGYISLQCLLLWHKHKKYINFSADEYSDFTEINTLSKRVDLHWQNVPLVHSAARAFGVMEKPL